MLIYALNILKVASSFSKLEKSIENQLKIVFVRFWNNWKVAYGNKKKEADNEFLIISEFHKKSHL